VPRTRVRCAVCGVRCAVCGVRPALQTFNVAALSFRSTSSLGLIGSMGDLWATSMLVNVGDQITTVVPVVEGVSFKHNAVSVPLGCVAQWGQRTPFVHPRPHATCVCRLLHVASCTPCSS
jgi:hypothetical protein